MPHVTEQRVRAGQIRICRQHDRLNKRLALNNSDVVKAFASKDLTPLKADWTRQDPRITQELATLGRNAVPVYAIYMPGGESPRLLPEVLTPSLVLEEIERLPARTASEIISVVKR